MQKIGIIGAGFTGTMVAVQLIAQATGPCELVLIDTAAHWQRGVAYNAYSAQHLLNVPAGKMSAFPDQPDHFLDWLLTQPALRSQERAWLAEAFLPRQLYGQYLSHLWEEAQRTASAKRINMTLLNSLVTDLTPTPDGVHLQLADGARQSVDYCVIATGNHPPRNPTIKNGLFYQSQHYFQNPWEAAAVDGIAPGLPVLIVGNGLSMVDTVFGLLERGMKNELITLSPHGFTLLPHRRTAPDASLASELPHYPRLPALVGLVNRQLKQARAQGVPAEAVVDALRPHTPEIWQRLTDGERRTFLARLGHPWNVGRHRLPPQAHARIAQLRQDGRLSTRTGHLTDLRERDDHVEVNYLNKADSRPTTLRVGRVINCTGPESNLMNLPDSFLRKCLLAGTLAQDALRLGLSANPDTFQARRADGQPHANLFTLGVNLRGELWESTAVIELRGQAAQLASLLLAHSSPSAVAD